MKHKITDVQVSVGCSQELEGLLERPGDPAVPESIKLLVTSRYYRIQSNLDAVYVYYYYRLEYERLSRK